MKLFGSTKSKITKDENGEKVPHLEIAEIILVHCNIIHISAILSARFKSFICICSY